MNNEDTKLEKVCFRLQVKKAKIPEYKKRHKEVWPEMLKALNQTGWKNYSLFIDNNGLLIGYFETINLKNALESMKKTDVNKKWQTEMSDFFEDIEGTPDTSFTRLVEIFNLEDQLSKHVGAQK